MSRHNGHSQEFPNFPWLHEFHADDEFAAADWKSGSLADVAYLRKELQYLKGHLTFFHIDLLVFLSTMLHKDKRVSLQPEVPCHLWSKIIYTCDVLSALINSALS